jgi:DNA repair photolyase
MIHELADAGVPVWVSVTPWVPRVTDITSVARGVGSTIPISVAPLNVNSPEVMRTGFGRRFNQREIDCAYLEERERSTELRSVRWLPPVTARGPDNQEQVMIPLKLTYFNEVDRGGHFAAWEEPELFSTEVRAAFKSVRS